MSGYAARRERMIEHDIVGRGITDDGVIEAMRRVPREEFVPRRLRHHAYEDAPLPIGRGQTISQPYIVALMIESLQLARVPEPPVQKALDVGTGSGYAAALLSRLVGRVYTIERHEGLAHGARETFQRIGYENIEVRHGDGTLGWPEKAPFGATLVSAAAGRVPAPLRDQLAVDGRLVVPVMDEDYGQRLLRIVRTSEERFTEETLTAVRFVPLVSDEED